MGFGALLKLKKHNLRMQLLEDLMMRFDASSGELSVDGHNLAISIDDIVTILGVNIDGDDVESQIGDDDDDVRVRFNLGEGQIKCHNLKKDMINLSVGEEFKGKFLLYVICRLLRPSTALIVPNSYLNLLTNIERVRNLNWAKFVYEGLLEGVRDYQTKDGVSHREQHVTGCILVLEIFYLEHVNSLNGIPKRRNNLIPRIRFWDERSISKTVTSIYNLGGVDSRQVNTTVLFRIKNIDD
ncbi:hypothetical protein LINPERHAP1_LOCUS30682 [Linum perenne]